MSKVTYLPLQIVEFTNDLIQKNKTTDRLNLFDAVLSENEDVLSFLYSDNFMNSQYKGHYQYINDYINNNHDFIRSLLIQLDKPKKMGTIQEMKRLMQDLLTHYYAVHLWSKSKQVYRFDTELESVFASASVSDSIHDIRLPLHILDCLPYHTFYIECMNDSIFNNICNGIFVHVKKELNSYFMHFTLIDGMSDATDTSAKFILDENDNKSLILSKDSFIPAHSGHIKTIPNWQMYCNFLINALLYLCADNNEIHESALTKQTYRPSTHVKNKFSEVRQWECGYRYGAEVRKIKTASDNEKETSTHASPTSRKPVIEHVRRAHWHHYWIGKRNTDERKLILHWIPPTLVRGTKCDAAVIHKVN